MINHWFLKSLSFPANDWRGLEALDKSQGPDIGTCVLEEQGDQMDGRGIEDQVPCLS